MSAPVDKELIGIIAVALLILGTIAAVFYGYLANIYKLTFLSPAFSEFGIEQVMRAIGILAPPLGVFLGYL
ncbi:hypothetical protein [Alcaligenes endophyticus]|uniref:Uncharacterized protein n=1 Tax=Alcaligenes endophyticus TaxID=1929088 RepID=A0ABT8EKL5_9BURK|nr:hypothetical protein [Alcaligenes endophyticus]MCX5590887.1 hypothetical protein [Alcaligenes endophyticus]MCX5592844.1 hypothetical protein [Alcaligenes endophyticus]MDN4121750.1 hypothetical protein [Alcaligenes endophyticus]MDN4122865.1 hypothetical protein [Alcaligenes endophyticus]